MSWPADGLPRFVVTEITGYSIRTLGPSRRETTDVMVVDRANCHRVVRTFVSASSTLLSRQCKARLLADELEAELAGAAAA